MRFASLAAAALAAGVAALPVAAQQPAVATNQPPAQVIGAQLRSLDKLVARVTQIDAPLNQEVKVGTLTITVRACVISPPEAPPESSAFLEITETKPGDQPKQIFSGWMFASSPALSALENPVYDVWVVACKTTPTASKPAPAPAGAPASTTTPKPPVAPPPAAPAPPPRSR